MQKKEPEIIANGNTAEEIYQWMKNKLDAHQVVNTLTNELDSLNVAREITKQRLIDAINQYRHNIVEN